MGTFAWAPSVSPWPAQVEGKPGWDFRDGETKAQGCGGTCSESHSPHGWGQVSPGQPDLRHTLAPAPQTPSSSPGHGHGSGNQCLQFCFLRIVSFVGRAHLARAPQVLLSRLRLPRGKHAQDALSVEIVPRQDRKGLA